MTWLAHRGRRTHHLRDRGASAVEYALLITAIAAVAVAVVIGLASIVQDAFSTTADCVGGGGTSTSCPPPTP